MAPKGHRVYDWARVALTRPGWPGRGFWLLVRRRLSDGELAFYACFGPAQTTLAELVRVAGIGWAVEMCQPQCTHMGAGCMRLVSVQSGRLEVGPASAGVPARRAGSALS
jgi:hypothetical protein